MPVRNSTPLDHPKILSLAAKIPAGPAFKWPPTQLQVELNESRSLVFEQNAQVRSFVCYRVLPDYFEITVLGTDPDFLRLGLQRELLKSLQELAAKQQKRILLEVHAENQPARSLYAGMTFLPIHTRLNYYSDGASALVLEWNNKAGCES